MKSSNARTAQLSYNIKELFNNLYYFRICYRPSKVWSRSLRWNILSIYSSKALSLLLIIFNFTDPIPDALRPETIPEIVTPLRGLYAHSIKRDLSDVAQEEALLLITLALESVLKDSIVFVSLDKAYSKAVFVCDIRKWLGMNNSSDFIRNLPI